MRTYDDHLAAVREAADEAERLKAASAPRVEQAGSAGRADGAEGA